MVNPAAPGPLPSAPHRSDLPAELVVEQVTVSDGVVTVETVVTTENHTAQLRTRRGEPVEP